ncbi:MAG: acetate--CoA ligase family protein [bacterium]|nr:acetate--CoA ligase family protein [bacterium]MDE0290289.1 acetate--CoA ligase family protein [bacterium]MDE0440327.1 acetate--CoA ligase family protein [bacterium]
MTLDAVFNPARVAVVGASDRPGKVGTVVWRNLADFDGDVVPVTSSSPSVGGVPAARSLTEVEGDVDLAVLVVPARAAPTVARQAAVKGVGAVVVLAGGFAEIGDEGAALQAELVEAAGQVRIVGPNCFGVQNMAVGLNASMTAAGSHEPGGIALITQSGAYGMAIHAMAPDEHLRFGKVYSSGNKADIGDHEAVRYLHADPATEIICLLAESVTDGAELAASIREAAPATPVIVAKTGRSEAGVRAARSHTGSLGTDDAIFRAAMRQAGAVTVRTGLEMLDVARLLAGQPLPGGNRAAIITNSGGTGVELVDILAAEGVEVPELSARLQARIADRIPPFASPRNPVDITPIWPRFAELYPWLVDTLARSGEVDLVIPVLLQRAAMDEATVTAIRDTVARLREDGIRVPVYCCWVAPRAERFKADVLQAAGIPCLEWPEPTARSVGHAVRYATNRHRIVPRPELPSPRRLELPDGPIPSAQAADVLAGFGIATVESRTCHDGSEALSAAAALGGPVVMKTAEPAIEHRADVGGVHVGLSTRQEVAAAYRDLSRLGTAVLVQPQLTGVEMVVGGLRDPAFGPVVMTGLGGTVVELLQDVTFALAPVTGEEAVRMIEQLRGFPLLCGYRGRPRASIEQLAGVITSTARLMATHPDISEIDLNPVMVTESDAVAVDWKVYVEETGTDSR